MVKRTGKIKIPFQSTPPARGATLDFLGTVLDFIISIHAPREGGDSVCIIIWSPTFYFNPRPPRGGRLLFQRRLYAILFISIHAPREGGDFRVSLINYVRKISIHAPREGGDEHLIQNYRQHCNFNPRPPRGGRPVPVIQPEPI